MARSRAYRPFGCFTGYSSLGFRCCKLQQNPIFCQNAYTPTIHPPRVSPRSEDSGPEGEVHHCSHIQRCTRRDNSPWRFALSYTCATVPCPPARPERGARRGWIWRRHGTFNGRGEGVFTYLSNFESLGSEILGRYTHYGK